MKFKRHFEKKIKCGKITRLNIEVEFMEKM